MFDRAIEKVGGAFKLTVLVQRRVREIVRGASPLVPVTPDMSPIDIALREILEEKIGYEEDVLLRSASKEAKSEKEGDEKKSKAKAKKKKAVNGADQDEE